MQIVHVGLGPLGRKIAADVVKRGMGEICAAVDIDPAIAGRPVREIIGVGETASPVARSLEDVQGWEEIDAAVVTSSSDLAACAETFRFLLRKGKPVVSTCEELLYPWLRHRDLASELDRLAKEHGGRLLGTGVNPGFLMDTLPVVVTGVCREVRSIKVWRVQDASSRREPFQRKIGAGLGREEFSKKAMQGTLRHVGLGESLYFIADCLGWQVAKWREGLEAVTAKTRMESAVGVIEVGAAAGVRQVATALDHGGREIITLDFTAAVGQEDPHDRIVVEGDPNLDLTFRGGVHGDTATIAITLNALPSLGSAAPGLHTMGSVPAVRWRTWR